MIRSATILIVSLTCVLPAQTGSEAEPVRYLGPLGIDLYSHDGGLPPVVGASNYQVMRANRSQPALSDGVGWTYNHQPMLAYWNGKFYVQYASNVASEPTPPGHTLIATSADGRNWSQPQVAFPEYRLSSGEYLLPHQRMGFYVAPGNRLLTLGSFVLAPFPRSGGIGRLVREIHGDGKLGPIYFIRYNRHKHWNEGNTSYPFYKRSEDMGFVAACEALLKDKLMTQQWWEEDRAGDEFYALKGDFEAPSFYHRKDGAVVGLWKNSFVGLSRDNGFSWSPPLKAPTLIMNGAKIWGQRTGDHGYALLYNPVNDSPHRWPLAIVTGEDGILFRNMLTVHSEVPPRRYYGTYKDWGPQYVRGIEEGNGNPADGALWVTYSVNKEDIWVGRVPLPVLGAVEKPASDRFDEQNTNGHVVGWNTYSPKWASVSIADFPGHGNRSLKLSDMDPYDYARAVHVFPAGSKCSISWRIFIQDVGRADLEVELLDRHGRRPVRLTFGRDGMLKAQDGSKLVDLRKYNAGQWYNVATVTDTESGTFSVALDGLEVLANALIAEAVYSVERVSFRTGAFRDAPTRRDDRFEGSDLPGADVQSAAATFYIDDVLVATR